MAYKSLGNAIRESVFSKKDAPTMLPDAMVEKLGLGEDDVLSMEEPTALTEAAKEPKFSSTMKRGKRYVILAVTHEGYEFYEVDNKTKLKDFNDTNGRYYDWIKNTKKLDESDEIVAIVKVEES